MRLKMKWYNMWGTKYLMWAPVLLLYCCTSKPAKDSRVDQLPYYKEATFTPYWFDDDSDIPVDFHSIPPFTLFNQNGDTITERHFADKLYVADFFFTSCPGICPAMTKNMTLIQEAFKSDEEVMLLSHSVTPMRDSVETLRNYADAKGVIDGKWELVTGERKDIYRLGRNFYFAEEDLGLEKDENDFLHTENFILVDKNRRIRGIYNGLKKIDINQLIADIETLKKEG